MSAIFGGGGSINGSGMGSFANLLMSGKASGGAIDRPTIVGENGAELFVPRTSGTIIPNGSWQGMAASSGSGFVNNSGNQFAGISGIVIQSTGKIKLFKSHKSDFKDGEQLRDFIYVEDVAEFKIEVNANAAKRSIGFKQSE